MVVVQEPGNYLKGDSVKSEGITEITIVDEANFNDGQFGKKLEAKVRCNDKERTEKLLTFNNTNHSKMMSFFGSDTKDWVGKTVKISTVRQQTPGGLKEIIYIDDKVE